MRVEMSPIHGLDATVFVNVAARAANLVNITGVDAQNATPKSNEEPLTPLVLRSGKEDTWAERHAMCWGRDGWARTAAEETRGKIEAERTDAREGSRCVCDS
jgi:hypothetical protein